MAHSQARQWRDALSALVSTIMMLRLEAV